MTEGRVKNCVCTRLCREYWIKYALFFVYFTFWFYMKGTELTEIRMNMKSFYLGTPGTECSVVLMLAVCSYSSLKKLCEWKAKTLCIDLKSKQGHVVPRSALYISVIWNPGISSQNLRSRPRSKSQRFLHSINPTSWCRSTLSSLQNSLRRRRRSESTVISNTH